MPFIREKELRDLRTRVEVAENFIMEDSVNRQQGYLGSLDTYGAFSRKIYDNIKKFEPASEEEQDEHFKEAMDAFNDSELMTIYQITDKTNEFIKKSGWNDFWQARVAFAYFYGLTDKKQEVS